MKQITIINSINHIYNKYNFTKNYSLNYIPAHTETQVDDFDGETYENEFGEGWNLVINEKHTNNKRFIRDLLRLQNKIEKAGFYIDIEVDD